MARLLAELDDGDTVVVTRLDRLARSTRDLLNTLAAIGAANVQPDMMAEEIAYREIGVKGAR